MKCRGCPVAIFLGAGSVKISKQGKEKIIKSPKRKRRKKLKNILEKITKLNKKNSEHYRKPKKVKKKINLTNNLTTFDCFIIPREILDSLDIHPRNASNGTDRETHRRTSDF